MSNSDIPRPAHPIIPFNGPSIRVSGIAVWFDAGAFSMNLIEQRPTLLEDGTLLPIHHEVARIMLAPATLVQLRDAIDAAHAEYRQAMGHDIPDPSTIVSNLAIGNLLSDLATPENKKMPATDPS